MATLLYPYNSGIALNGSMSHHTLQPSPMATTGLPWLSPFTPSQREKDFLLGKPYEDQHSTMSTMTPRNQQSEPSNQPTQQRRRSSTKSGKNENISPERAKHLERNRISANKCRMKKKKEHARMQSLLDTESAKRDSLLSEVGLLKDELWYLKNMIFDHAKCDNQHINNQLSKMTQSIMESSTGQLKCASPAFSASTLSDGSVLEEPGPSEHPATLPARGVSYGACPDSMFDSFIDLGTL